jgi:hypothetical protein
MSIPIRYFIQLTQTPKKTPQIITTDNDTLFRVIGVAELFPPVFIADNATKHTLVITKQDKSHKTARRDSDLKGSTPSIPRAHDGVEVKITIRGMKEAVQGAIEKINHLAGGLRTMFIVCRTGPATHRAWHLLS